MEDFANILQRDYGLKPQGKAAPMSASGPSPAAGSNRTGSSSGKGKSGIGSNSSTSFGDLLGDFNGSSSRSRTRTSQSSFNDDLLGGFVPTTMQPAAWAVSDDGYLGRDPSERDLLSVSNKHSGTDDLLGSFGVSKSGLQAGAFHGSFEDDLLRVIQTAKSSSQAGPTHSSLDGDLLGGFKKPEAQKSSTTVKSPPLSPSQLEPVYDDFLPGFGVGEPMKATNSTESTVVPNSSSIDDLFSSPVEAGMFAGINSSSGFTVPPSEASAFPDLLDPSSYSDLGSGSSGHKSSSRVKSDTDDGAYDGFDGFTKPTPVATVKVKEPSSPSKTVPGGRTSLQGSVNEDDIVGQVSFSNSPFISDPMDSPVLSPVYPKQSSKEKNAEIFSNDSSPIFDEPVAAVQTPSADASTYQSATNVENLTGEKWLTIDDVKLVTEPSASPPPTRAPPDPCTEREQSIPVVMPDVIIEDLGEVVKPLRQERRGDRKKGRAREDEWLKGGRDRHDSRDTAFFGEPEFEAERGVSKDKDHQQERAALEKATQEVEVQREIGERVAKQEEAREREVERLAERTKKAAERVMAEAREREAERAKKAAERVVAEARERAAKAAVERVVNEARERAEKAAVQRAAAAREQEQVKEREREREKQEAEKEREKQRERKEKEKERERERQRKEREKEERERREKEKERERERERDRERDSMRERERGAAEQLRKESANFRATSEPRQRPSVNLPASGLFRPSSGNSVNSGSGVPLQRQSSGAQKVVDDWTSIFTQPAPTVDEFQGEPAERRRIRLEKHQRIEERAAKVLDEKHQRDMALQMEQDERHRSAGNLDAEIRRWSMGKEGNLRALLSSLHLMLWPECNWKPVSLTDLITGPSVKKAYQRAILCVHPDKVQQKGATVQQKYIAEKVFDLLKEAFAKFNASELY
ncbi:unnamed protein product [Sphagnum troendelagicum]|uniref:Auxilin-like protein n=1 Tax=Sphagnum troendelagicum TaxID=128251 RepID=A0ABP0TKN6_9BRYO